MILPTLACMSGSAMLVILAIMAFGGLVLFFITLVPYRYALRAIAKSRTDFSPASLFGATLCVTLIWAGALYLTVGLFSDSLDKQELAVAFCGSLGSVLMLLFLLLRSNPGKTNEKGAIADDTSKPFQIWAQDLFIALVCYGAGLAILSAVFNYDRSRVYEFLPWAVYVLLAGSMGLLFAIDLCRRQAWTQIPAKRAGVFVAVFTFFPLTLPLAMLAWWRWRRALTLQAKLAKAAS